MASSFGMQMVPRLGLTAVIVVMLDLNFWIDGEYAVILWMIRFISTSLYINFYVHQMITHGKISYPPAAMTGLVDLSTDGVLKKKTSIVIIA